MNERDKRAVESMALCGIDLDGLKGVFKYFPSDEVEKIYHDTHTGSCLFSDVAVSMNCS